MLRAPAHRRQGRLEPRHQRGPGPRSERHRRLGRQIAALRAQRPRGGAGLERRDRRGHEAPRLDARGRTSIHELQAAAAVGQMGLAQIYEIELARARHRQRAGAADARRPGRPRALPQRALDAADAARARRRPGHQRERHRRHRRDQVRRQRHARRAGRQPGRGRRAGDPDRPGRACTRPIRASDPQARCIDEARAGDPALERMAGGAGSSIGRGGMLTKVLAAKRAARSGAHTVIAWGREPDVLLRLAAGEAIGTQLVARHRQAGRAQAVDGRPPAAARRGGARRRRRAPSCAASGKSLLPIGVRRGARRVRARRRRRCARPRRHGDRARPGQLQPAARRGCIARRPSSEIEALLGYVDEPELIHRDNLVLV